MKIREKLRLKINEWKSKSRFIWEKALSQSQRYEEILGLNDEEFDWLETNQKKPDSLKPNMDDWKQAGFLKIVIDGEEFVLSARNVCGEKGWQMMIIAICTTNQGFNISGGDGTSFVNTLVSGWHKKLASALEKQEENYEIF